MSEIESARPRMSALTGALLVLVAIVVLIASVWVGANLFGARPVTGLAGDIKEVQTTGGTYVGRITSDDGEYVTVVDAAIVQVESVPGSTDSQVVVRSLRVEPYGLGAEIRISLAQIVFIGSVATDSQLASAYRQALSD